MMKMARVFLCIDLTERFVLPARLLADRGGGESPTPLPLHSQPKPAWMKGQRMQICVGDCTKHTVIGSMKGDMSRLSVLTNVNACPISVTF
ncbi:MAG: hypothetical protein K6F22_02905 [Prevotella sp.]|nr:hypothetical protein [Prevotella sp.]